MDHLYVHLWDNVYSNTLLTSKLFFIIKLKDFLTYSRYLVLGDMTGIVSPIFTFLVSLEAQKFLIRLNPNFSVSLFGCVFLLPQKLPGSQICVLVLSSVVSAFI